MLVCAIYQHEAAIFKPKAVYCRCSGPKLCPTLCDLMDCSTPGLCPPLSSGVSNSCPLTQWCYLTFSYSVAPSPFTFSLSQQARSFPMSQLFLSSGQSIGASASPSVFPMNIQGWFLLRLTGLISLLSNGHSRVFSSTTIKKHQFWGTQPSLWSNSHIHTWLLEKP